MESDYFDQPSFIRLSDSINDHRNVPNKYISTLICSYSLRSFGNENRLSQWAISSISSLKCILCDVWLIVDKIRILYKPVEENNIGLSSCYNVLYLMCVESDIMLHLSFVACESRCDQRLDSFFIVDLPNRYCLWNAVWESDDIVWIRRNIKINDSIFMWCEVSSFRSSPYRIPNNKHWILTWVCSHNQILISATCSWSDSIAMSLQ